MQWSATEKTLARVFDVAQKLFCALSIFILLDTPLLLSCSQRYTFFISFLQEITMRVLKFGGSSVASEENIKNIAQYLAGRAQHEKLLVVVSARGKTTDQLIAEAYHFSNNPVKRELDRLLSTGEQQTIALLAIALRHLNITALSLTAEQAGITAIGAHTKGKISTIDDRCINSYLTNHQVVIIAGFQAVNDKRDITTLGRGGSDTSAVALAATLNCECEIYTDVNGIYGIDPRLYSNAKKLERISYEEMMEMASLGAKVMEPRSIEIASKNNTIVYVAKTLSHERGTYIMAAEHILESKVVSGISLNDKIINITLKNLPVAVDTVANVFETMANYHVNVDMISQITYGKSLDLMFTASQDEQLLLQDALRALKEQHGYNEVWTNQDIAKVGVVGIGMRDASGVAGKVFSVLKELGVHFYQTTTSDISISLTVDKSHGPAVVTRLAEAFNL